MPRLSIVIPCVGGGAEFDGTLVSVLQNRPADCEVLVLHTESYNDPYALQGEVRFIEGRSQSSAGLLNAALDVAVGEVLHVVGCGLEATEGWTAAALSHFDDPDVAAVTPVVHRVSDQAVVAAGLRWSLGGARKVVSDARVVAPGSGRLRAKILGPTLTAAFYRRDVLVAIGGFETAIGDELADVSAALDLQSLGKLCVCEPASRLVQSQAAASATTRGFAMGRAAERLFWRNASAQGLSLALALHPFTVAADAVRQGAGGALTSLIGRAAAWFEVGAVRRNEQRLIEANQKLLELAELRNSRRKSKTRAVQPSEGAAAQRRRAA